MLEDLKKDATARMQKCVQSFQADLKKLRTGRAHPSLVEHLKVDYYGSDVPLQQVASISVEDARTLVVSPWEKNMVGPIEKAIHKSELGLTPNTAGTVIRVAAAAADRGASPGYHQDRAPGRRERARQRAQRAPRRPHGSEGAAEGKARVAGRGASRTGGNPEADRPLRRPRSISSWRRKKRKSCRFERHRHSPRNEAAAQTRRHRHGR